MAKVLQPKRAVRGGRRPGAGRPPVSKDTVSVSVTLPQVVKEQAAADGEGNISAGLRIWYTRLYGPIAEAESAAETQQV